MSEGQEYRYQHFTAHALGEQLDLDPGSPGVGDPMPSFELQDTDDVWIRREQLIGSRPALLMFGCITDPLTIGCLPMIERLYAEYGNQVEFITAYVREAHPGENYRQPDTIDRKMGHARALKDNYGIPWRVAIDDIEGSFHRALGSRENAVFLMDESGLISYISLFGGREDSLREALESVCRREPVRREERSRLVPLLRALGCLDETLELAGPEARRELRSQLFPVYVLGRIARFATPLSPLGRGIFSLAVSVLGIVGAGYGVKRLARSITAGTSA